MKSLDVLLNDIDDLNESGNFFLKEWYVWVSTSDNFRITLNPHAENDRILTINLTASMYTGHEKLVSFWSLTSAHMYIVSSFSISSTSSLVLRNTRSHFTYKPPFPDIVIKQKITNLRAMRTLSPALSSKST